MTAATRIQRRISKGLARASTRAGSGPLIGTIKRRGAASGRASAPTYAASTEHTFTLMEDTYSERERAGTLIKDTDVRYTASTGDIEPATGDTISVKGVEYRIHGVDPLRPGGDNLMFDLWVRKI